MADAPPTNFQSNQNYDPDIKALFKDFVTGGNTPNDNEPGENIGIDDVRAKISVSITGTKTKDLIASLNIDPKSNVRPSTANATTPVILAQESRCHAFYRIIGFPVVATDKSFYNPGFDIIKGKDITRSVDLSAKITIANKVGSDFEKISQAREIWAANTSKVFSVPQSVEAGVLCLTSGSSSKSGPNIRKFSAPFIKNALLDPFDFKDTDQTYSISNLFSIVGDKEEALTLYQGPNATAVDPNYPNTSITNPSVFFQHKHIIVPFMVDPRIDFSIGGSESSTSSGLSKRIAVPFVPDGSFLQVGSSSYAERPLLEKIITDRLYQNNQILDAGQAATSMVDYIKNLKSIQSINIGSTTVGNIFGGNIFKQSEQDAFANYLSIIQALMFKLVQSTNTISAAQGLYYWLPIPSILGPEGGCTVRNAILNQNFSPNLVTSADLDVIKSEAQVFFSNITSDTAQATAAPDRSGTSLQNNGQFAFSGFFNHKFTFDSSTSSSMGDLSTQNNDTLTGVRSSILTKAGDALQIIEMIMGEFSGFGLVDIVAIMGSLYIMPINDVLGFLDDDAIVRASDNLGVSLSRSSLTTSLNSLAETVNGFYQIMDQVYQDFLNNNALNLS